MHNKNPLRRFPIPVESLKLARERLELESNNFHPREGREKSEIVEGCIKQEPAYLLYYTILARFYERELMWKAPLLDKS